MMKPDPATLACVHDFLCAVDELDTVVRQLREPATLVTPGRAERLVAEAKNKLLPILQNGMLLAPEED